MAASSVYTIDDFPAKWAMIQHNLSLVYHDRIKGDQSNNIELSIKYVEKSLTIYTKESSPIDWAMAQNSLAISYNNRIKGDRAENSERSISYYKKALEIYTKNMLPLQWAMTHVNIAVAYIDRIEGDQAENIELAIQCCEKSLEVYTKETSPIDWAMTQNNLAIAYIIRVKGDRKKNVEESISCCELALEVYTEANLPIRWAKSQNNLAAAYRNRVVGEHLKNLNKSISCYKQAIRIMKKKELPIDWAKNQINMATCYQEAGEKSLAINHYLKATEVFRPKSIPINALIAYKGLGNVYFDCEQLQEAMLAYDKAIQSAEISRRWSINQREKQRVIRDALMVYENAIQCAIGLLDYVKAIEYTEKIRARQLVDFMATNYLNPINEIPVDLARHLKSYEEIHQKIQVEQQKNTRSARNFEFITSDSTLIPHSTLTTSSEIIQALEVKKQEIWQQIRLIDPTLAIQKEITPIDLTAIQTLVPQSHQAILSIYTTDNDTHIFIIQNGNEPQLHTCQHQGWKNLQEWLRTEWLENYAQNKTEWRAKITPILIELAERLQIKELTNKLVNITEIIIIPHLYLHQIPFSALPISDGYLGDKFTISYAPSCQLLSMCADRQPTVKTKKYGTIENADNSLPGASYEGEAIAKLLDIPDQYRLKGSNQATITNFQQLLKSTDYITHLHNATHGQSRLDNPMESAIFLADGKLTLDRLMISRYPHLQEIFLAACETHLGNGNITDDILTIATGFMCAGASTVISTLWAVDDIATALFSIFYYQNCQDSQSPAKAIKNAQKQLRQLSGTTLKKSYQPNIEQHFMNYIEAIEQERTSLKKQRENGSITADEFDTVWKKLRDRYNQGCESSEILAEFCKQEKPFADGSYWAAFVCQGLG